jgi:amino acid adenylation domain-containing protein
VDGIAPTDLQRKLMLQQSLYPKDAAFNLTVLCRIVGSVDLPRLRSALQHLLSVCRPLNTSFVTRDEPVAVVTTGEPSVAVVPVPPGLDAEAEAAHVAAAVGARADVPIPAQRWPQYEVALYLGTHGHYLSIIFSHLVSDAITMFNFAELISAVYTGKELNRHQRASLVGAPAPARVTDPTRAAGAFRDMLAGVTRLTHEQLTFPREPGGVLPGRRHEWRLDAGLTAALRASPLVETHGAFTVFAAAHTLLISALAGTTSVVIGVPMAARSGWGQMYGLGYYINTLPLAIDLSTFETVEALCTAISTRIATMLRYHSFDLTAHAAEVFADRPVSPLQVDNVVTFYRKQFPLDLPGCTVDSLFVPRDQVRYPVALNVLDDGAGYTVGLEYADQLAPAGPLDCLETVLRTAVAAPDTRPTLIGVLSPDNDDRVDRMLNRHQHYETPASLDAWFAAAASAHPDRIAISDAADAWTYAELDRAVERVARTLRATGCGPAVAVAGQRRRELVAVLLGVLRSGRYYVPLDPHAPAQRIQHIVDQFDPVEELSLVADPDVLPTLEVRRRIAIDDAVRGPAFAEPDGPVAPPGPDDLAYVIFTSGSTGVPRGVEITHGNVMRLVASADAHYDFAPDDVWCLFHSYAFDVSVWEIFGSLLHGGRLHVIPDAIVRSPADFASMLADERVTVLNQTPSAFRRLLGVLTPELAERLAVRWVVFAGEALPFDLLRPWIDAVGTRARLVNMYGITETTVHTTFFEVDPASVGVERASVIGVPLDDTALAVVDGNLNRCPVGVAGELLVVGPGVARGYRRDPAKTAERFLRGTRYGAVAYRSGDRALLRPDGNLVYLDRVDRQVQLRGYRIEPGEVETALRAIPGVKDAYVALRTLPGAEPCLVAWVVATGEHTDRDLRTLLRDRLPHYMVPAAFVRLGELPLTVNGKVDTVALPQPRRPAADAATDSLAGRIAAIWMDVVGCAEVGVEDNFFDVGGTSMHVARVHARLAEELGAADLTMLELFEYPTPSALAERLSRSAPAAAPAATPVGTRRSRVDSAQRRRAARTGGGAA